MTTHPHHHDAHALRNQGGLLLGIGTTLVLLGSLAILFAIQSTLISVILIGGLLIVSGILQLAQGISTRAWSGFALSVALGILALVTGIMLIREPEVGAAALTLIMSIMFIVKGSVRIVMALTLRFVHWIWVLISGALSLILGLLLIYQWPLASVWVIGTFIGIDLIFNGWALIMLGVTARKLFAQPQHPQH